MSEIYDTDKSFDFNKLVLTKPSLIGGGNYFIRFLVNNNHLYVQPPKCITKQGFIKTGKRYYIDLMFTNENEEFINWMENLENHCHQYIYKNRANWFDSEMEIHDIENYFTSPLKLFKSGKFYIVRVNVTNALGKPNLKIYDEDEKDVSLESINDKTNVISILEIQGIRCSTSSFSIDIELKQMMVLKPDNLFERALIKTKNTDMNKNTIPSDTIDNKIEQNNLGNFIDHREPDNIENTTIEKQQESIVINSIQEEENTMIQTQELEPRTEQEPEQEQTNNIEMYIDTSNQEPTDNETPELLIESKLPNTIDGMEEIEFNLEELPDTDTIVIKQRNDVYYKMYKEARKKAKLARDLALSSYLEAKKIKNTYMLEDISDSDDSDVDFDSDDEYDMNENTN
uniref:Uncharacterized protein n=1 Tax=viral metagenome TaxID=1070528 RepID=A0A6C0ED87_9ZZZZ